MEGGVGERGDCGRAGCIASDVAIDQVKIKSDTSKQLNDIFAAIEAIKGKLERLVELTLNVNHLSADFLDFRHRTERSLENAWAGIHELREQKAERVSVDEIKSKGVNWLVEILKAVVILILGVVLGKLI